MKPIWTKVEFGGMSEIPPAGEIDPGSCVGWLVPVEVEWVVDSFVVLGGSTKMVEGTKSLFSVVVGVWVTMWVVLVLECCSLVGVGVGVLEGTMGEGDALLVGTAEGALPEPSRPAEGEGWVELPGPLAGVAVGFGLPNKPLDELGRGPVDESGSPRESNTPPKTPPDGEAEGFEVGTLTEIFEGEPEELAEDPSVPNKPPKSPPRRPADEDGVGLAEAGGITGLLVGVVLESPPRALPTSPSTLPSRPLLVEAVGIG